MTGRRFSQAISEGDGISVVAEVNGADSARQAEEAGAEGVLVHAHSGHELGAIREAVSVPVLVHWTAPARPRRRRRRLHRPNLDDWS